MPEVEVEFYDVQNGMKIEELPGSMDLEDIALGMMLSIHRFIGGWVYFEIKKCLSRFSLSGTCGVQKRYDIVKVDLL